MTRKQIHLTSSTPINILLVEDSPSDAGLAKRALGKGEIPKTLHIVENGEEAIRFLCRQEPYADSPRPDFVLLDLNLPGKNGHEVLAELKSHDDFKEIPVIVLSASRAARDVRLAYRNMANCYIAKPTETSQYADAVKAIESFWLTFAMLPGAGRC